MLSVTVLGSGTVDPVPQRASSGFYLQTAEHQFVIDLGAGTLRNAQLCGLEMWRLENLVLTHFHPDHTSDLVPFLFARKYAPQPWSPRPLQIFGPSGTKQFLKALFAAWPSLEPPAKYLSVIEMSPDQGAYRLPGDTRLSVFQAEHGDMAALSLRFELQNKTIAFSGDTALCPGVIEAAKEADLFFCECSCFPRGREPLYCRSVHLSWEDVAEICQQAEPRRLILTHLYELVLRESPSPEQSLRQVLSIPLELAEDRARIEL